MRPGLVGTDGQIVLDLSASARATRCARALQDFEPPAR